MALRDVHQTQTKGAVDGQCHTSDAEAQAVSGRGPVTCPPTLVQRCMWHKRENVVSYLPKDEQASWRRRLQHAYDRETYSEAKAAPMKLHRELESRNQSAATSLAEGLEETLTLRWNAVMSGLRVSARARAGARGRVVIAVHEFALHLLATAGAHPDELDLAPSTSMRRRTSRSR